LPTSSRFAVAVHILTLLQMSGGEPVTSERIAGSVNTHPAVIRRLLSMLAKAGIATSQLGAGGGALLARPADRITLLDVYEAVEDGDVFAMHHGQPNPACPVGRQVKGVLEVVTTEAQRAMHESLARRTIADVLADVETREAADCRAPAAK
jgi:Rrf2 family protein